MPARPRRFFVHAMAPAAVMAILCAAIVAAYLPGLAAPFVMDDFQSVAENRAIRSLWPISAVLIFPHSNGKTVDGRPMLNLSLAINRFVAGPQPAAYRAGNMFIHCANACLLAWLLLVVAEAPAADPSIRYRPWEYASLAAAVWALHPLCTAAVTYVIQRAESLAACFMLMTTLCVCMGLRTQSSWARMALLGMAALWSGVAGLTKETAAVLPLVTFAIDRSLFAGSWRAAGRHWRWHLAAAASVAATSLATLFLGGRGNSAGIAAGMSPWLYLLTQAEAFWIYVLRVVWPTGLVFDYGSRCSTGLGESWPWFAATAAAVIGIVVGWIRLPVWFLGPFLCLVLLAPTSSIVPVKTQTIAEHRLYLPLAALVASAVAYGYSAAASLPRRIWLLRAGLMATAFVLGVLTVARNREYLNAAVLWRQSLAANLRNDRAALSLATELVEAGSPEALAEAERLLDDAPRSGWYVREELVARRQLYLAQNRLDEALQAAEAHVALSATAADGLVARGLIRWKRGEFGPALADFDAAVERDPAVASAWTNRGNVLIDLGRLEEAAASFGRAIALEPDNAIAWWHRGIVEAMRGDGAGSLAALDRAVALAPRDARAHHNRASVRHRFGDLRAAHGDYSEAVKLDPNLRDAYLGRCEVCLQLGDIAGARADLQAYVTRGGRPAPELSSRLQDAAAATPSFQP